MAQGRHVGEEDADLTVLHLSGGATILPPDASRVLAPFGEATFIHDQHGEGSLVRSQLGPGRERVQRLLDQAAHLIAHPVLVPDGAREQALHAVGSRLPGVFSDLPAIFPGDVTEDGLQVVQRVLAYFGAREVEAQTLMQLAQGQ